MVRTITKPIAPRINLSIPAEYVGEEVEILVFPVNGKESFPEFAAVTEGPDSFPNVSVKAVKHSAFGRLKAYANPSLIQEEEGAWERATAEKARPIAASVVKRFRKAAGID